jgi:hypothetical protein
MKSIFTFFALTVFALSAQAHPQNGPVIVNNRPISFSGFYTAKDNSGTVLVWSTPYESGNNNFEIQRSTNGSDWKVIAIMLGAGTATTAREYCFKDREKGLTTTMYRIRQVDNSTSAYSAVK